MVLFLIILSVVVLALSIFFFVKRWEMLYDEMTPTIFLAASISFFLLTIGNTTFNIISHCHDLGEIRMQSAYIEASQERVAWLQDDITKILGEKHSPDASILVNTDSPVKGIVDQLSKAEVDLANTRMHIVRCKARVESRRVGPWWFIVSIYGDK